MMNMRISRELTASFAFVDRNFGLVKRYLGWELVFLCYSVINVITIGFIMVGRGDNSDVLYLVIGALMWGFLSVVFHEVSESVSWERWEGTIEYTFMAPILRFTHLAGSCSFAILYSMLRIAIVLALMPLFFDIDLSNVNVLTAVMTLVISSLSFLGLGLMAAVLPLMSTEKGSYATHIMGSLLMLISGVYYEVDVLPNWIRPFSVISPGTYTLRSMRAAIMNNASIASRLPDLVILLIIGIVLIPLGLWVFHLGEIYAKKTGKLKRSG
jgi:ABC-2 type transport system permease protein